MAIKVGGVTVIDDSRNLQNIVNPPWETLPPELPSQSGNTGKFLTTNGSAASWATPSGVSTGKSIAMAMIFG